MHLAENQGKAMALRMGALVARGMPAFPEMSDGQLDALRHYFRQKARDDLAAQPARSH